MKKLTFEEFVIKAKKIHGDTYMYPEQTYSGRRYKVTIVCKEHGEFKQTGGAHIDGKSGCPSCGSNMSVNKRALGVDAFVCRAKLIYGNLDSYDNVVYVNTMTPVIITCNKHSDYKVRPHNYLRMGQRCTDCTKEGTANPNPHKQIANDREKQRLANDPMFAMVKRLRKRLRESVLNKHEIRDKKLREILGCSYEELLAHLESKFLANMSWENMNLWHIDHIIPLASAKSLEDVYRLNHYTNLQPLWAEDNLRKNARLPDGYCV